MEPETSVDAQALATGTIPRQSMDDGSDSDDVDAESDEDRLQRQFLCELKSLREQVAEKDTENELLREKIAALTDNLVQTTEELAHRMVLFSDVMTRSERLDAQIANAKKTLLTKEMQLHDLTQEKQALTTQLAGKEKEREHWEHEFVRVEEQLSDSTRRIQTLHESLNEHKQEVNAWKSKMKRALRTVDALKRQLDSQNEKEAELTQNLIQVKREETERERSWHTRNAKLECQLHTLERELEELRSVTNQAEVDKQQAQEDEVVWKSDVAAQQLEKQKQIVHLREEMSKLRSALEKVQVNEKLMHREIRRLREELLLSESQRETEQRRFDQLVRGKDKEVAFIWQKYLDVMSPNIHASNKSTPN
uniref:Uncharacterized protein n=1 Tax=Globisporangium ultimum (strain ATCC 200006 / CBS 805.95 / DAOM BR144) TaxID=431595 RepID=K3WPS7_GLOUD